MKDVYEIKEVLFDIKKELNKMNGLKEKELQLLEAQVQQNKYILDHLIVIDKIENLERGKKLDKNQNIFD